MIMTSSPITSWQINEGKNEDSSDFISWASMQMMSAASKLKDTCSLEEKQ